MKQLVFMAVTMLLGTAGPVVLSPVYGIAVYYLYAVLRPQFDLGMGRTVRASDWAKSTGPSRSPSCTLVSTVVWRLKRVDAHWRPSKPPWYGNPAFIRSHYLFLAFCAWIGVTFLTAQSTTYGRAGRTSSSTVKIFVMFICATLVLRTVRDLWIVYLRDAHLRVRVHRLRD